MYFLILYLFKTNHIDLEFILLGQSDEQTKLTPDQSEQPKRKISLSDDPGENMLRSQF